MNLIGEKTIWWPTWQGWMLLLFLGAAFLCVLFLNLHRFLAVMKRAPDADILVVEGWVPRVVVQAAADEFLKGSYRLLLTTDERASDVEVAPARTTAATRMLISLGVPEDRIRVCPVEAADSRRSHRMAVSVVGALGRDGIHAKGINTFVPGTHARKTWLAYRRALPSRFPVGIVAVQVGNYDPSRWWRSSPAAKSVIVNGTGWLYELIAGAF